MRWHIRSPDRRDDICSTPKVTIHHGSDHREDKSNKKSGGFTRKWDGPAMHPDTRAGLNSISERAGQGRPH